MSAFGCSPFSVLFRFILLNSYFLLFFSPSAFQLFSLQFFSAPCSLSAIRTDSPWRAPCSALLFANGRTRRGGLLTSRFLPSSHRRHRCSRDVGCRSSQDQPSSVPPRGEYISAPRSHPHTHRRWPALFGVWQSQHRQDVTPGRQSPLVMLVPRNICDFYTVDRQLDRQIISEVGGPLHNQPRAAAMSDCLNFGSCAEYSASDY